MANFPDMIDKQRLGVFLEEIKNQFPTSVNNVKPNSKGNITLPTFTGASSSTNGKEGIVPAPKAGEENLPLLGSSKFSVLPVIGGGTGANNAAEARTNLGIDGLTGFNPVGSIIAFAGNTLPKGYLLCDGSNISRTTYKDLFNVIGTTYGTGNGSTTFTLPNLIDRFIEGSSVAGSYLAPGLPNITASQNPDAISDDGIQGTLDGAFYFKNTKIKGSSAEDAFRGTLPGLAFDASLSNKIYGAANTVQPSALRCQYLIKY